MREWLIYDIPTLAFCWIGFLGVFTGAMVWVARGERDDVRRG